MKDYWLMAFIVSVYAGTMLFVAGVHSSCLIELKLGNGVIAYILHLVAACVTVLLFSLYFGGTSLLLFALGFTYCTVFFGIDLMVKKRESSLD